MKENRWIELLYLFSSLFMLGLLFVVLIYSLSFWIEGTELFFSYGLKEKTFWLAVVIAIVTTISQWMEGRIRAIIISVNKLKGRVNGKGRRKKR